MFNNTYITFIVNIRRHSSLYRGVWGADYLVGPIWSYEPDFIAESVPHILVAVKVCWHSATRYAASSMIFINVNSIWTYEYILKIDVKNVDFEHKNAKTFFYEINKSVKIRWIFKNVVYKICQNMLNVGAYVTSIHFTFNSPAFFISSVTALQAASYNYD